MVGFLLWLVLLIVCWVNPPTRAGRDPPGFTFARL